MLPPSPPHADLPLSSLSSPASWSSALPFPLLADTSGDVSAAYAGFKLLGILKLANRKTYLIGPDGTIAKRYDSVDPDKHSAQIINDLKALM